MTKGATGVRKPIGMQDFFNAPMRAVVEDIDDPDKRLRVRVRVVGLHTAKIPVECLPWGEVACFFVTKQAGDFMPFKVGDLVWVMFEGGDRRLPVVIGSWVSRSGQINDVPNNVSGDYVNSRKRWTRVDRVGNKLELSELSDEQWARLVSGAAEVICDQKTDTVTIKSPSGTVKLNAQSLDFSGKFFSLGCGQIIIAADDLDGDGGGAGVLQLMARLEASLYAQTEVFLGGYLPRYQGAHEPTEPTMKFRQSDIVSLRAREAKVGTPAGETIDECPIPETETVEVNGVVVKITAVPATNSPSGETPKITIECSGDVEINSTGGKVTVNASDEVDINADKINLASGTSINLT